MGDVVDSNRNPGPRRFAAKVCDFGMPSDEEHARTHARTQGVILVYDVTRKETFENLEQWLKEVTEKLNLKLNLEQWLEEVTLPRGGNGSSSSKPKAKPGTIA